MARTYGLSEWHSGQVRFDSQVIFFYAVGDEIWANYVWVAENRLTCVAPASSPVVGDKKVEFRYDYLGRRAEKRVYTWLYVTDHYEWVDSDCRRFVWYNWLPVLELQVTNPGVPASETVSILRKYTWGLDLAGQNGSLNSIDSAGGIGGLLACYDTNGTTVGANPTADDKQYIYLHDANGNVGQVIDWTNAAVSPPGTAWSASRLAAAYEYDPYGNVTASAGGFAAANPFRFSTKYWDDETGLGYWGYRYYSPRLGRWVSRDPYNENGDYQLYRFNHNSPPQGFDAFGLKCCITWYLRLKGYECCGNLDVYHPSTQCCTNYLYGCNGKRTLNEAPKQPWDPDDNDYPTIGTWYFVESKTSMWICRRPLYGTGIPVIGPISHSYVCCDGPNVTCYGIQGKINNNPGTPVPRESILTGECREVKVCPSVKRAKCNKPICNRGYNLITSNCHRWANEDVDDHKRP